MSREIVKGKINCNQKLILTCVICASIFGFTQIKYVMYIPIIVYIALKIKFGKLCFSQKDEVILIFLALIVPDNYFIVVVIFLFFILEVYKKSISFQNKYSKMLVVGFSVYLGLNIIINFQKINNILFYLFFNLPFLLTGLLINNQINKKELKKYNIDFLFKNFLLIEGVSVICYGVSHFKLILSAIDNDWVSGTLGQYHSDVLMIVSTFAFLYFLSRASYDKKWRLWAGIAIVLALSTTSVTYTISLLLAFLLSLVFTNNMDINKKIRILFLIVLGVIVFYIVSPRWVTAQLLRMFDINYLLYRAPKIQYFINTFCVMPFTEGIWVFLFGTGVGLYSSRAAETCAGSYIGIYDKLFPSYSSKLREKYIESVFNSIDATHEAKTSILGSARSSILSISGELGLIGFMFLFAFIGYLYSGEKNIYKNVVVTFFVFLMIFESVTEFAKMVVVFWIVYECVSNSKFMELSKKKRIT